MRVLVTGHKGYIGTVLVPMLLAERYDVIGLDCDLFAHCTFGTLDQSIPELKMDVRDVTADDLQGFDAVLHLAGLANDPLGDLNPELTDAINRTATARLAEAAKKAMVERFIFSSSCSSYGAAGEEIVDEASQAYPVTPYGRSKLIAERELSGLADETFSPTSLRNATAYGVSPRLRFDLVLNNLVAWAYTTGIIRLKSDGTAWRPIIHIEDISRAFIAVLQAPRSLIHNQVFNVGRTEENYQIRELAEIVKQTVPGSRIEFAEDAGRDARSYRVDCSKIARSLRNFRPQWNAQRGAKQLYDAYCSDGLELADFEGPRYRRVDHLRQLINSGQVDASYRWRTSSMQQREASDD